MIKIGATDCGEPCFNLSWVDKLKDVDGAVIISKGLGHESHEFKNALLDNKDKIIFHCTITGLGGTNVEPNVPDYMTTLRYLDALISLGFPSNHVVIRIDPIIGSNLFSQLRVDDTPVSGMERSLVGYQSIIKSIITRATDLGIARFRISFLDIYPHVRKRFKELGFLVPEWAMDFDEMDNWKIFFQDIRVRFPITIESCAEKFLPKCFQVGCISKRDFEILGLDPNECQGKCYQRKTCLCSGNKVELLQDRKPCSHGCLYCFWMD